MSRKSLVMSALMFVVDFFSALFKELKKRGVTEERIFDALKSKDDLISQMAEKIADVIVGTKNLALKYLTLVERGISVTTGAFSKSSFFANGPNLYLWDNFKNWVLTEIPDTIPAFEGKLSKFSLTKKMYDSEIQTELGNPNSFSVTEFAAIVKDLVSRQPKGESGTLLNNGYANIFYVVLANTRVVAVRMRWSAGDREWSFSAFDLDDVHWGDEYCVFSRS